MPEGKREKQISNAGYLPSSLAPLPALHINPINTTNNNTTTTNTYKPCEWASLHAGMLYYPEGYVHPASEAVEGVKSNGKKDKDVEGENSEKDQGEGEVA